MSTIVLKTAKRNTIVPRLTIRRAVEAIYTGMVATPLQNNASPVVKIKKKAPAKKAS